MVWGTQTPVPLDTPPRLRSLGLGRPGTDQAGDLPPHRMRHPAFKLSPLPSPSWTGRKLRPGLGRGETGPPLARKRGVWELPDPRSHAPPQFCPLLQLPQSGSRIPVRGSPVLTPSRPAPAWRPAYLTPAPRPPRTAAPARAPAPAAAAESAAGPEPSCASRDRYGLSPPLVAGTDNLSPVPAPAFRGGPHASGPAARPRAPPLPAANSARSSNPARTRGLRAPRGHRPGCPRGPGPGGVRVGGGGGGQTGKHPSQRGGQHKNDGVSSDVYLRTQSPSEVWACLHFAECETEAREGGGAEARGPFGSPPCALTHCGPRQSLMSPHPGQMRALQRASSARDRPSRNPRDAVVSAPPRGGGPVTSPPP